MNALAKSGNLRIELFLGCRNLIKPDTLRKGDATVAIFARSEPNADWDYVARTEIIRGDNNPEFQKSVVVTYKQHEQSELLLSVFDGKSLVEGELHWRAPADRHMLGSSTLSLRQLATNPGKQFFLRLQSLDHKQQANLDKFSATVWIRGEVVEENPLNRNLDYSTLEIECGARSLIRHSDKHRVHDGCFALLLAKDQRSGDFLPVQRTATVSGTDPSFPQRFVVEKPQRSKQVYKLALYHTGIAGSHGSRVINPETYQLPPNEDVIGTVVFTVAEDVTVIQDKEYVYELTNVHSRRDDTLLKQAGSVAWLRLSHPLKTKYTPIKAPTDLLKVSLNLRARALYRVHPHVDCSPFAVFFYKNPVTKRYVYLSRTEVVKNNSSPEFLIPIKFSAPRICFELPGDDGLEYMIGVFNADPAAIISDAELNRAPPNEDLLGYATFVTRDVAALQFGGKQAVLPLLHTKDKTRDRLLSERQSALLIESTVVDPREDPSLSRNGSQSSVNGSARNGAAASSSHRLSSSNGHHAPDAPDHQAPREIDMDDLEIDATPRRTNRVQLTIGCKGLFPMGEEGTKPLAALYRVHPESGQLIFTSQTETVQRMEAGAVTFTTRLSILFDPSEPKQTEFKLCLHNDPTSKRPHNGDVPPPASTLIGSAFFSLQDVVLSPDLEFHIPLVHPGDRIVNQLLAQNNTTAFVIASGDTGSVSHWLAQHGQNAPRLHQPPSLLRESAVQVAPDDHARADEARDASLRDVVPSYYAPAQQEVEIVISCRNLFTPLDGRKVGEQPPCNSAVFLQSKEPTSGRFVYVDKTEFVPGDFNPIFRRTIVVPRPVRGKQVFRLLAYAGSKADIVDPLTHRSPLPADRFLIGSAAFSISDELLIIPGKDYVYPLKNKHDPATEQRSVLHGTSVCIRFYDPLTVWPEKLRATLSIGCRRLIQTGFFKREHCAAQAVLFAKDARSQKWLYLARTETIEAQANPSFAQKFLLEHDPVVDPEFKICIYDILDPNSPELWAEINSRPQHETVLAVATFRLSDILAANGREVAFELRNPTNAQLDRMLLDSNSQLWIHASTTEGFIGVERPDSLLFLQQTAQLASAHTLKLLTPRAERVRSCPLSASARSVTSLAPQHEPDDIPSPLAASRSETSFHRASDIDEEELQVFATLEGMNRGMPAVQSHLPPASAKRPQAVPALPIESASQASAGSFRKPPPLSLSRPTSARMLAVSPLASLKLPQQQLNSARLSAPLSTRSNDTSRASARSGRTLSATTATLSFACRSLIKVAFARCNPMLALYARDRRTAKFACIGHTELARGFVNPFFTKTFSLPYAPWDDQELIANVYDINEAMGVPRDDDVAIDPAVHELIGSVRFSLNDVASVPDKECAFAMYNRRMKRRHAALVASRSLVTVQCSLSEGGPAGTVPLEGTEKIKLNVGVRNILRHMRPEIPASPLIALFEVDQVTKRLRYLAQTEVVPSACNASFSKQFVIDYDPVRRADREVQLRVYDMQQQSGVPRLSSFDVNAGPNEQLFVGEATFQLRDILADPGHECEFRLRHAERPDYDRNLRSAESSVWVRTEERTTERLIALRTYSATGNSLVLKDISDAVAAELRNSQPVVQVPVEYDTMPITVGCRKLCKVGEGTVDPLVALFVKDNRSEQFKLIGKTGVMRCCSNPRFDTRLHLEVPLGRCPPLTYKLSVYDASMFNTPLQYDQDPLPHTSCLLGSAVFTLTQELALDPGRHSFPLLCKRDREQARLMEQHGSQVYFRLDEDWIPDKVRVEDDVQRGGRILVNIGCRDLVTATHRPQVDCIAAVFLRNASDQKWQLLGRTEVHVKDRHPTFARAFEIDFDPDATQMLIVNVYEVANAEALAEQDYDLQALPAGPELLGSVRFRVNEIVRLPGKEYAYYMYNKNDPYRSHRLKTHKSLVWAVSSVVEDEPASKNFMRALEFRERMTRKAAERLGALRPSLAAQFDSQPHTGCFVVDVVPNGPADAAGLRIGDVVRRVDGVLVQNERELHTALQDFTIGSTVPVHIHRPSEDLESTLWCRIGTQDCTAQQMEALVNLTKFSQSDLAHFTVQSFDDVLRQAGFSSHEREFTPAQSVDKVAMGISARHLTVAAVSLGSAHVVALYEILDANTGALRYLAQTEPLSAGRTLRFSKQILLDVAGDDEDRLFSLKLFELPYRRAVTTEELNRGAHSSHCIGETSFSLGTLLRSRQPQSLPLGNGLNAKLDRTLRASQSSLQIQLLT